MTSVDWVIGQGVTHKTADKAKLAKAEGGYHEVSVMLPLDGEQKLAFTFVADTDRIDGWLYPYTWYKRLVLAGAREHGFPGEYIAPMPRVPQSTTSS